MYKTVFAALAAALLCSSSALAAPAETADAAALQQQFNASLNYQSGDVSVPDAHAALHLTDGFRYLATADARRVLEELWGNPEDPSVLGMLVPGDLDVTAENSWVVVLTYSEDGFVSDEDATKIDYTEMLQTMQQETADANADRKSAGYGKVDLIGWARAPHYDAAGKKLYWAKELAFEGASAHTLNYDIRALGRGGYLSMNAVANMDSLAVVERDMQKVLKMTEFDSGHRYADFNESTDQVAGYGLAALVGGVAASKLGLFAKLGVLLLSLKKFAILFVVGAAALLKKFFGKKDADAG